MQITGADLVIKALKKEKVDTLFAYPGGQVIDIFHSLFKETAFRVIVPRHEQGLIHAADGYARSTGKVGVCLVTSGPGAANLVTGIATAQYDSVPLVCFTGQVPTALMGKCAFQEVDIVRVTKSICKHAVMVRSREDLARTIKEAFVTARSGRPGVVVVDLPKDIQRAYGSGEYPDETIFESGTGDFFWNAVQADQTARAWQVLKSARRPVFLVGGGVKIAHAQEEMTRLAERTGVPVLTTIMGKGAISSSHPLYVGNIGIHGSFAANHALHCCDVLFAVGTRFNDRIAANADTFAKETVVIHIDIDQTVISRNVAADIAIVADAKRAVRELLEMAEPLECPGWLDEIQDEKREHPVDMGNTGLTPQAVMEAINNHFTNAIIATDVGQNQMWATQFLELDAGRQMLTSGGMGTMGYGLPAAVGAKIGNPEKDVLVVSGDGGIQMYIQVLATAVCQELPLIICILNNSCLGNVRQWQELFYDRCYSWTCMRYRKSCPAVCDWTDAECPEYVPDFIRLAQSYGAKGIRVTRKDGIDEALAEAKRSNTLPTVIEFRIEREANVLPIVPPGKALNDMVRTPPG